VPTVPGPAPAYQPRFTAQELAEVRKLARSRVAPYGVVQRAKLALLLYEHPNMDNPSAARQLGQHENWVRLWRKRWSQEGFTVQERKGRGRKP
jgi:hypothetical protein